MEEQQETPMHHSTQKECACITHQGPHWLHMDHLTKRQNVEQYLRVALGCYRAGNWHDGARYLYEYKQAEMRRMDEKVRSMVEGEQYPYTLLGEVEDVQALALSIHQQIQEAIKQQINGVAVVEAKQQALF